MTEHPFDRVIAVLRERGATFSHLRADSAKATCPVHSDLRPSLQVTRKPNCVLLHCFAGCPKGAPARALGFRPADLFTGAPLTVRERGTIVATYDYVASTGEIIARKIRFEPKEFRWRRPDPSARSGFRWGLDGLSPGLYRLPELTGAPVVYVVEGEKAAARLASLGLVATCPHAGASTWKSAWSAALFSAGCRSLVIFADHDRAGLLHAERVAVDIHVLECDEPITVKIVELPGLAPGEDVVDYFEAGHVLDDLLAVVASTPVWVPGAREQRRAELGRARARDRKRAYRARTRTVDVPALTWRSAVSDQAMLDAVLATLVGQPKSGRALVAALGHQRAVERALVLGVQTGVLIVEGGERRGQAKVYRLASGLRSGTEPPHSSDIRSGTALPHLPHSLDIRTGQEPPHLPHLPHSETPIPAVFSEQMRVRQSTVPLSPVPPRERSSFPLQENPDPSRHTHGTARAALRRETRGTHRAALGVSGAEARPVAEPAAPLLAAAESPTCEPVAVDAPAPTSWRERVKEAEAHPDDQQLAISVNRCCGKNGAELRCRLCRWSPTYHGRDDGGDAPVVRRAIARQGTEGRLDNDGALTSLSGQGTRA